MGVARISEYTPIKPSQFLTERRHFEVVIILAITKGLQCFTMP